MLIAGCAMAALFAPAAGILHRPCCAQPPIADELLRWDERPKPPERDWESFEGADRWRAAAWTRGAEVSIVSERATDGRKALLVRSAAKRAEKAVVQCAQMLDLSPHRWLVLDIYADSPCRLAVAFTVGTDRQHFETPPVLLKPGWNRDVAFDLRARHFKSQQSNWQHTARLELRRMVRETLLVLLPAQEDSGRISAWIDDIRFVRDPARALDPNRPVVVELRERRGQSVPREPIGEGAGPGGPARPGQEN